MDRFGSSRSGPVQRSSALSTHTVDVLLLNAGTSLPTGPYTELDNWRKVSSAVLQSVVTPPQILDVNLFGVINGVHALVPLMVKDRSEPGCVVITGSKQGITCPPGNAAYNVSKAGVKAVAEQLAHELRNGPISVHLLVPGWTYTGLTRGNHASKPEGAWTAQQVVDYALPRIEAGSFYILCPDNSVDEATDKARVEWSVGDILNDRPALSRWNEKHKDEYEAHVKARTGSS